MASLLEHEQPGIGDLARQRVAVRGRKERIVGAVHDQRRGADLAEPLPPAPASIDQEVVGLRGDVAAAVPKSRAATSRQAASSNGCVLAAYARASSTT